MSKEKCPKMSSYDRRVALFYLKSRNDKKKGPRSRTNPTKTSLELARMYTFVDVPFFGKQLHVHNNCTMK